MLIYHRKCRPSFRLISKQLRLGNGLIYLQGLSKQLSQSMNIIYQFSHFPPSSFLTSLNSFPRTFLPFPFPPPSDQYLSSQCSTKSQSPVQSSFIRRCSCWVNFARRPVFITPFLMSFHFSFLVILCFLPRAKASSGVLELITSISAGVPTNFCDWKQCSTVSYLLESIQMRDGQKLLKWPFYLWGRSQQTVLEAGTNQVWLLDLDLHSCASACPLCYISKNSYYCVGEPTFKRTLEKQKVIFSRDGPKKPHYQVGLSGKQRSKSNSIRFSGSTLMQEQFGHFLAESHRMYAVLWSGEWSGGDELQVASKSFKKIEPVKIAQEEQDLLLVWFGAINNYLALIELIQVSNTLDRLVQPLRTHQKGGRLKCNYNL